MFSYTLLTVFVVDLLSTAGDIALSWTSPVYPKLYSNDTTINPLGKPITAHEDAWLGSLVTFGAILGPFPFGYIAQKFGRRIGLLSIALPHSISYLIMAFSKNIYLFYFGRVLGGLAMGGGYTVMPMYVAEIAQNHNRGAMSQTLSVFSSIGNFLPYAIGPFMSIMWFNVTLACIPTIFFVIFFFVAPETPHYLVSVNKDDKAEKSLMLLRSQDKKEVEQELSSIKEHQKHTEDGHFSDILRVKGLRKALFICLVLIIEQELCGFCAIIFYLQPIFETVGAKMPADIAALIVGFAMLLTSSSPMLLIDRFGRKMLIIYSCFGMFVSLTIMGTFFYLKDFTDVDVKPAFFVLIISLVAYIFFFNFGICSVPWTLAHELFPNNVKQVSSSVITSACWITSFLTTKFFNDMNDAMGRSGTFWFFGTSCLLTAIFSIFYVPETKGKSFREIQEMLNGGHLDLKNENELKEMLEMEE